MTAIDTKTSPIDIRRELYGSFIQPSWKKHESGEKDYLDTYFEKVKNPHTNQFRFTVLAAAILLLGGAGKIVGPKRFMAFVQNVNKSVQEHLSEVQNHINDKKGLVENAKIKVVDVLSKPINIYYSSDKYKDFGVMTGLFAVDKLFNNSKIKLPFLTPGKWIFDLSKLSLRLTGGNWFGLGRQYKDAEGRIGAALKALEGTKKPIDFGIHAENTKNVLTDLKDSLGGVIGGKKERLEELEKHVENINVANFKEKYWFHSNESFSENMKRIIGNWKKVFAKENKDPYKLDVLRENWETKTEPLLKNNLMKTTGKSGKTFGESLEAFDKHMAELEAAAKEQPGSKQYIESLKNLRNKLEDAIKFETDGRGDGYAGRAVDLYGGGGMQESVITLAAAGIIGTSTIKGSKKGDTPADIGKRFVKTGGLEFLGGLGSMFYIQFIKGISGPRGIAIGAITAVGMNIAKKIIMKATGQTPPPPEKALNMAKMKTDDKKPVDKKG